MAEQIQIQHSVSGATLYALIRNSAGEVWDDNASAFVPYATADLDDYDLPMTEQGTASRYYAVDMPLAIGTGQYSIAAFDQAGGSPAEADTVVGGGDAEWSADEQRFGVSIPLDTAVTSASTINSKIGTPASDVSQDIADVMNAVDGVDDSVSVVRRFTILALRSDAAIAADFEADLDAINQDTGSGPGTYDNTTDSVQAIRDATAAALSAVETDTQDIQSRLPAALVGGRIDATVDATGMESGAIDAILDDTIGDGTLTMRQALRVLVAGMAGKLSGAATTTITIRNAADTANVIVATCDADGNRSAVTVTP